MSDTIIVAAGFAVLLSLEWRYRRSFLRVGSAVLALAVLFFFQPNYTSARRQALAAPPSERDILRPLAGIKGDTLSEYHSGVYTTMRFLEASADAGAGPRLAAVGALFWLACSQVFRRAGGVSTSHRVHSSTGADATEA